MPLAVGRCRDGVGYLTLEQLLRLTGLLVAVAAAGRRVLGLTPLPAAATAGGGDPQRRTQDGAAAGAAAQDGGGGGGGGVAAAAALADGVSRALLDGALSRAFLDHGLPAEGLLPPRLTGAWGSSFFGSCDAHTRTHTHTRLP